MPVPAGCLVLWCTRLLAVPAKSVNRRSLPQRPINALPSLFFLVGTAQINSDYFLSNLWIEIASVTTRDARRAQGEQQVWKKTCLISVSP